jgi:hypothetical protein
MGNDGWLISQNSLQYTPSFSVNKEVIRNAGHYGRYFVLSMSCCASGSRSARGIDHRLDFARQIRRQVGHRLTRVRVVARGHVAGRSVLRQ